MDKTAHHHRRMVKCFSICLGIFIAILLAPGSVSNHAPNTMAQSVPTKSTYNTNSPHWSHINISDFGRDKGFYASGSIRNSAYEWYARHMDSTEMMMDTFHNRTYEADTKASTMKALNPSMNVFGYDNDLFLCQHVACVEELPVNTAFGEIPEEYFLHFSQDTHIDYYLYDGTPHGSVDIPGCPEPGPVTAACRVQVYGFTRDKMWVFNMKNLAWRTWFANHLLDEMDYDRNDVANPVDTLFLDLHGPGWSVAMYLSTSNIIQSGGNLREYNGLGPSTTLDTEYNNDVSAWLAYLRTRLEAQGKSLRINTAEYFINPLSFQQAAAANGTMTEHLNKATSHVYGATNYQQTINQVRQLTANGGTVDLGGSWCDNGPDGFPAGNYPTGVDRYRMWNLASYYMMKEATDETGIVYFDPNLCINSVSTTPIQDLNSQWLAAYEINVGQPVSDAVVAKHGAVGCAAQGYSIFSRQYTNARILVRSRDGGGCQDYTDTTAVTVPLDASMVMLEPDGTISAPITSVSIRNAEAVILFLAPDITPPAAVQDLIAR